MQAITTVGLDIAKSVFQVHGVDAAGQVLRCMSPVMALSGQTLSAVECPLSDNSGQPWFLARDGLSAFDPKRTSAVHCGNGFDAGFSPY